jgi:hypothetical protein
VGNLPIPYSRPNDGSNFWISILAHVGSKGLTDCQRPNDGSKVAKRSFKSHRRSGGTRKAEAAKLPGAGIGPKQCLENERQKKDSCLNSVRFRIASKSGRNDNSERVDVTDVSPTFHLTQMAGVEARTRLELF